MDCVRAWVLLYDAECGLCRWSLGVLLRWDRRRRLRPVALQDPEAAGFLPGLSPQERLDSFHVVSPDGRVFSAGAAVPPLVTLLPGGGLLARATRALPRTTERLYRWIAGHRDGVCRLLGSACHISRERAERGRGSTPTLG